MTHVHLRILYALFAFGFIFSANADFVESRGNLKNSIRIQLGLTLSSIYPRVCIADTAVMSGAKSIIERFVSPANCTADSLTHIVEGFCYSGIYVFFISEGLTVSGKTYTINHGLIYTAYDSTTYVDSGRTLERYLLNILSQSKVIDSILPNPLTYYVPESLLVTTRTILRPHTIYHATHSYLGGNYFLFDLGGRMLPPDKKRFVYRFNAPGIIISHRSSQYTRIAPVFRANME